MSVKIRPTPLNRPFSKEGSGPRKVPGFFLMLYGGLEGRGKSLNVGDFVFHPHCLNAETERREAWIS